MSILTLQPAKDMQFQAVATSLGFSETEARRFKQPNEPLTERDIARVRRALEQGLHTLWHAECQGVA